MEKEKLINMNNTWKELQKILIEYSWKIALVILIGTAIICIGIYLWQKIKK